MGFLNERARVLRGTAVAGVVQGMGPGAGGLTAASTEMRKCLAVT